MNRRTVTRWTLRVLVVLVALVAAAAIVLQTPWAHERARLAIESRAAAALNGELRIGALAGSFWGGVTFTDLSVTQHGAPVISAARVDVRYRPWRVFTTRTIDEVVIRGLRLNVVQERDGWNVLGLGVDRERDPNEPPPRISIARLEVHEGGARIAPQNGRVRQIADLEFAGALDYAGRRLRFDLDRASARDPDSGVAIRELSTSIDVAGGDVSFDRLHLVTGGTRADGRVQVADGDVNVDVRAAPLSLPELSAYLPAVRRIGVSPEVTAEAKGSMRDMSFALAMTSEAGSLRADGRMARTDRATKLNAEVHALRLDLSRWLNGPAIDGLVTADGTIESELPDAAPADGWVKFDVKSPEFSTAGYRATTVRARGTYRAGVLDVQGAAAAYGSLVETAARWDGARLDARGRVLHVNARRLPRQLAAPSIETDVSGTYEVSQSRGAWTARATLEESTVEGGTIARGAVVSLARQQGDLHYEFHGNVIDLDVDRLRGVIPVPPERAFLLRSRLTGRIDAAGRNVGDVTALTLDARLVNSVLAGAETPVLNARVTLDRQRLSADVTGMLSGVSNVTLGLGDATPFHADGAIDVHLALPDIHDLGHLEAASGRATAHLTNASVKGVPIDALDLDAALAGGVAEIRQLSLRAPDATANASGTLALDPSADVESDATYDVTAPDLSKFEALIGRPIAGGLSARGRLTGPAALVTARGDLNVHQLSVASVQALTIEGTYDVTVPDWTLPKATSKFSGTGTFVQVGSTRIDRVRTDAAYREGRLDVNATIEQQARTISLAGALIPHPEHREVHVSQLSVAAGGPKWQLAAGREALVQYGPSRLHVANLDLVSGDSRIAVNGTVGAAASTAEPLRIEFSGVRIADINQILLGTHQLDGRLDGRADVTGTLDAPRVSATLAVVAGAVDGVAFERLDATADYADDSATVDIALEAGAAGRLTAAGSMPVRFGTSAPESAPPFNLRVTSQALNLGLFKPALGDHVDVLAGTGNIDLTLTGPARRPVISGSAEIVEGSFTLAATGGSYAHVNASLSFDGTRLNVRRFHVEDDDRHVASVTGGLNLSELSAPSDFNLEFTSRNFHLLNNKFGEISVTSDLRAMGDLQMPLVTGTVSVDRARLEVDDLLDRFGASGGYMPIGAPSPGPGAAAAAPERPSVVAEREAQQASAASNASYSVTLALPDTVILRGRDLRARGGSFGLGDVNVTVGGALSIAKDPGGPMTLLGSLSVVRGSYAFQGRRFSIARGSELRFEGGQVLNPLLNVTAERQIGGVLARVHVTGMAREPRVELSSDPPLDDGDVLSLIAFNQTMNELGTEQRVSLASRAGTLAARALAAPLADSVGRALDFDVFEIQPADDSAAAGTVTIGRQVTEELFVGFRQNFGSDDVSQVSFEYRINEFLRLVTSFAQGADRSRSVPRAETAGLDLFFVIRKDP